MGRKCMSTAMSVYTTSGSDCCLGSKARPEKVKLTGQLTNGEDIADSGLAQAYAAWRHSTSLSLDKHETLRLPGLDFTDDQLFFIAFARVWETLARPATAVVRVRTDPHSPPYYRVVGTLRNMKEFHEAFKCKSGSGVSLLPPSRTGSDSGRVS